MELNALTRWESIGKDLYAKGQLGHEIERIKQFSHMLSAARKQHRAAKRRQQQHDDDEEEEKETPYTVRVHSPRHAGDAKLTGIQEEDAADSPVLPLTADDDGGHRTFSATSSLPLLYPLALASAKEEEHIQDELEKKELDEIPLHHARVSTPTPSPTALLHANAPLDRALTASSPSPRYVCAGVRCTVQLMFFVYRAGRRFMKGFAVGYIGKLLFGVVSSLLRSRGHLSVFWQHTKPLFFRADVTGYGLFLGGFLAVFESLMRVLKRYKETFGPRRVRVTLSAAAAGLCFLFLPREYRVSLAMFFFVRALEIAGSYLVEHGWSPPVPHADTLLMASASSAVIWCWLFHRSALDSSYAHFLDVQSQKPRWLQQAYSACHYGNDALFSDSHTLNVLLQQRAKLGLPALDPASTQLRCDILHPGQSHVGHMLTFLKDGLLRALPVYIPVYVLPLLVFRMKDIVRSPLRSAALTSVGIARSSLFLSAYCTACWYTACVATRLGSRTNLNGILAGWMGGCMVLIEKRSRRIELALYVLAQAIPAMYRYAHDRFGLPFVRDGEAVVFMGSIAVIMAAYILRPHLLRRSYLSLLMFFFGSGGRTAGFHTKQQRASPLLSSGELSELEKRQMREAEGRMDDTTVTLTNGMGTPVNTDEHSSPTQKKQL